MQTILALVIVAAFSLCSQRAAGAMHKDTPLVLRGHSDEVTSVAFSHDGLTLASAADDKTIRLWDVESGKLRMKLAVERAVHFLAFTKDDRTIIAGDQEQIAFRETRSGKLLRSLEGSILAISPDGSSFLSEEAEFAIGVRDIATGKLQKLLRGQTDRTIGAIIWRGGERLLTASRDGIVTVRDYPSGKNARELPTLGLIYAIAVSPDESEVAQAGGLSELKAWEISSGEERFSYSHGDLPLYSVAYLHDGNVMVTSTPGKLIFLERSTSKLLKSVDLELDGPAAVLPSPSGKRIAVTIDRVILLWTVERLLRGDKKRD